MNGYQLYFVKTVKGLSTTRSSLRQLMNGYHLYFVKTVKCLSITKSS